MWELVVFLTCRHTYNGMLPFSTILASLLSFNLFTFRLWNCLHSRASELALAQFDKYD